MAKIRMVVDIWYDNEPDGAPRKTDDEICKATLCDESETIDGFEIYPRFSDADVSAHFYLTEASTVAKGLVRDGRDTWSRYLDYLIKWSLGHSDSGFSGMSPACYDEWLDNEEAE